jgi:hypothetical protein
MSYTVTAKCPVCRAAYLVSCRTAGVERDAERGERTTHSFTCERCDAPLHARVPADAKRETINVRRDHEAI